jgi:tetratricopeptide (TPR) repeat protein
MPDEPDEPDEPIPFYPSRLTRTQMFAFAGQIARERAEAIGVVPRILAATALDDLPGLVEHPELLNCGAIDRLRQIFDAEMARNPEYAEAIAALAVALSAALPNTYPALVLAQARGVAWKNHGKVLAFLGRYDVAFEAFDVALRLLGDHPTLAHDRAIVLFNLALTYQETGRYSDSLPILAECRDIFRIFSDNDLLVSVALAEGALLQRLHKHRDAREIYLLLLASTMDLGQRNLAALHHAIGFCSIELGEFDQAEISLAHAAQLHRSNGEPLQAAKAEFGIGRIFIRRGLRRPGLTHLRKIRHQFLRHSLAEEAGICGLEMVEAFLLEEQPEAAEHLARTIISEFLAAGLNTRAITALGYLSEAIATRSAEPKHVSQVREYILSLQTAPEREFEAFL